MNTPLKKYIKKRKTNLTNLAKSFGISRGHLTMIANGEPAGKSLALKIEEWSNGEITCLQTLYPVKK
jgi:DNA-binding Xre family transcriptional regulator